MVAPVVFMKNAPMLSDFLDSSRLILVLSSVSVFLLFYSKLVRPL